MLPEGNMAQVEDHRYQYLTGLKLDNDRIATVVGLQNLTQLSQIPCGSELCLFALLVDDGLQSPERGGER